MGLRDFELEEGVDRLRLARPVRGRPETVEVEDAPGLPASPETRIASFPTLDDKRTLCGKHRLRRRWTGPSLLRVGFYLALGGVVWMLCSPSKRTILPSSEKEMLIHARDVAEVTRTFLPELGRDQYWARSHWLGREELFYRYESANPGQPTIACLFERSSGLSRQFEGSRVIELLREFDWRTQTADNRGLVTMPDGVSLGDSSECYFIYEDDRPVGNVVVVRFGTSTLSVVLGGVVLLSGKEAEKLLSPVLSRVQS